MSLSKLDWFPHLGPDDDDSRPAPRPRVAPTYQQRSWRVVFAAGLAVALIFGAGTCTGNRLNDAEVRDLMLDLNDAEVRSAQASDAADYWQSEATSATAAFEVVESDVASLTAELNFWQQYASEASSTIATLKQQKATPKPKPVTPTVTQASYNTAGVEQWRSLVAAVFPAENVDAALSVMRKESGGNPNATNSSSGCAGLFQIHPCHAANFLKITGTSDMHDPSANIAFAAYMSNGGRNWSSWSVRP